MNQKTPRALVQFSAILLVLGVVIMDPLAGLFILVLAGILAAIALAFGSQGVRIFAILWPNRRRWPFGQRPLAKGPLTKGSPSASASAAFAYHRRFFGMEISRCPKAPRALSNSGSCKQTVDRSSPGCIARHKTALDREEE